MICEANLWIYSPRPNSGSIAILSGSCLTHLSRLEPQSFDGLITSPPYCNRYDYTRTYALELAFLDTDEEQLRDLRQQWFPAQSRIETNCTWPPNFLRISSLKRRRRSRNRKLLRRILQYLEGCKAAKLLNNNGIPRMVWIYFRAMGLVIFACARVLKTGAPLSWSTIICATAGAAVPVDLILSDIAEHAGFDVETIWVLPIGKGNSSQQMGKHGRDELRKCVYISTP